MVPLRRRVPQTGKSEAGRQNEGPVGPRERVADGLDRGPFSGEAKWDLTSAAAQMLGFTETDRIGAIRLDPPTST